LCQSQNIDFRYINSFKLANFHRGASDLEALNIFNSFGVKQKNIHNLHAKIFIIDDNAIITSSNLTVGGLRNNIEYGILIKDDLVNEIKQDYMNLFNNDDYPEITSDIISKAKSILESVPSSKQKRFNIKDSDLFEEIINDEIIEEKYDGGIESIKANLSSWKKDVFECLLEIDSDVFNLEEVYAYKDRLQTLHQDNRNIKPKIRQQLQYLRDIGLIEFIKPGLYKKLWK